MSNPVKSFYITLFLTYWGEARERAYLTGNEDVILIMDMHADETLCPLIEIWVEEFLASDSDTSEEFFLKKLDQFLHEQGVEHGMSNPVELISSEQLKKRIDDSIELPFKPGDPLYWISHLDGVPAIKKQENGIVGVVYLGDEKFQIIEETTSEPMWPNKDDSTCLTYEKALEFFIQEYGQTPEEVLNSYKMWARVEVEGPRELRIYMPKERDPVAKIQLGKAKTYVQFPETGTKLVVTNLYGNSYKLSFLNEGSVAVRKVNRDEKIWFSWSDTLYINLGEYRAFTVSAETKEEA